jgi:hypothetical protein
VLTKDAMTLAFRANSVEILKVWLIEFGHSRRSISAWTQRKRLCFPWQLALLP